VKTKTTTTNRAGVGIWTPQGEALCKSCHGPLQLRGVGVSWPVLERNDYEEGYCTGCGGQVFLPADVAQLTRIQKLTGGKMQQTGGMCCALLLTRPNGDDLVVYNPDDKVGIAVYPQKAWTETGDEPIVSYEVPYTAPDKDVAALISALVTIPEDIDRVAAGLGLKMTTILRNFDNLPIPRPLWLGRKWQDGSQEGHIAARCTIELGGLTGDDPIVGFWISNRSGRSKYTVSFSKSSSVDGEEVRLWAGTDDNTEAKHWARAAEIAQEAVRVIIANPECLQAGCFESLHDYCDANVIGGQDDYLDERYERLKREHPDLDPDSNELGELALEAAEVVEKTREIIDLWLMYRNRANDPVQETPDDYEDDDADEEIVTLTPMLSSVERLRELLASDIYTDDAEFADRIREVHDLAEIIFGSFR
jgi:hypothetical protein